jgi:type I restriction enzyme R subunit
VDDARIAQAVAALTRITASRLMEANRVATGLLLDGLTVGCLPDWDGGRDQTIRSIDQDHPERNRSMVSNPYRID